MDSNTIFELKKVSVEFDKHSIKRKTLRETVGNLLGENKSEKFCALKDISLTIKEGEHVGIIGRNGAGKSTLLKVISKVIIPSKGSVGVKQNKHIIPMLELGIGFQPDLSGRENCFLAGYLMGYTKKEIGGKIEQIISFADLGQFIDEPVKNYSSGMYARLAFSIATDINPDVLMIDEVFGVGDEFFMKKCLQRMKNLMNSGVTTIFVAHNIDFLVDQCDRFIWIDNGKIVIDGEPQLVAEAYRNSDPNLVLLKAQ
jgi:homopolymeric O-antigen transport system ATP-binding protein